MIYHKEIGFPRCYRRPVGKYATALSRHARTREVEKGFRVPAIVDLSKFDVIEIEMSNGIVTKMVIRGEYSDWYDIVLVVIPRSHGLFVKTAWLNEWDDNHSTLDASKYARP